MKICIGQSVKIPTGKGVRSHGSENSVPVYGIIRKVHENSGLVVVMDAFQSEWVTPKDSPINNDRRKAERRASA